MVLVDCILLTETQLRLNLWSFQLRIDCVPDVKLGSPSQRKGGEWLRVPKTIDFIEFKPILGI